MIQPISLAALALAASSAPALGRDGFASVSMPASQSNGLTVHRWAEGAAYPLITAPGQVSIIALEPGEQLISAAAGDTSQWVIGDTASGKNEALRRLLLVKPIMAGLRTNLVIATDRRIYQLALESRTRAPLVTLSWTYAEPSLIALKGPVEPVIKNPSIPDPSVFNFSYRIEGDRVAWRPVRAFDDGKQTFIEFAESLGQTQAPPLFLKGADGKLEITNYRLKGRFYIVDRLFAAAELRIGEKRQQKVTIVRSATGRREPGGQAHD